MSIYTTHKQDVQTARYLLLKAKGSGNPTDAWRLVDFLYDQCILDKIYATNKDEAVSLVYEILSARGWDETGIKEFILSLEEGKIPYKDWTKEFITNLAEDYEDR